MLGKQLYLEFMREKLLSGRYFSLTALSSHEVPCICFILFLNSGHPTGSIPSRQALNIAFNSTHALHTSTS